MDSANAAYGDFTGAGWDDQNMTRDVASQLAASMTDGWGFLTDFWPQVCTAISVLASIYIVGSNMLSKVSTERQVKAQRGSLRRFIASPVYAMHGVVGQDEDEASLLETVFSAAALCTGLASLLMLGLE